MSPVVPHPRLAFRVGVTGHRSVVEDDSRIGGAVDDLLRFLRTRLDAIAASPRAALYEPAGVCDFGVVSALAEGADRLVAQRARNLKMPLYAPLPFPHDAYLPDFPHTRAVFEGLLEAQSQFELDGDHRGGEAESKSYEAVGRFVVRNCDLLIAVWDGEGARGQGGAESTAEYAVRAGLKVWWIHAREAVAPRLLSGHADFLDPEEAPEGEAAFASLAAHLEETLLAPKSGPLQREGLLNRLGHALFARGPDDDSPLDDFFAETSVSGWSVYNRFMNVIAPDPVDAPREDDRPGVWTDLYLSADRLSNAYGDRYRSSYVMVAALAIVALASAAFGGEKQPQGLVWGFVVAEVAALLGVGALVAVNYTWRWHERWIGYRLLAELARKQRVLSQIGQSLPGADVAQLTAASGMGHETPRDAWIAWLYMAHRRAAPSPVGRMADVKRAALDDGLAMVDEQIKYHERRRRRSLMAEGFVRRVSEGFFIVTVALAFVKLALVAYRQDDLIHDIVFLTAAASSVATAFVGVRAYSEFALLARHSAHMIRVLEAARHELETLRKTAIDGPMGSAHLGRALYSVTTAMMQDIGGWSHLFRVKTLEAG